MSSIASYFQLVSPPSIYAHAQPLYYVASNRKHYIIITPQYENNSIYVYDFDDNEFHQQFHYPSNFKPTDHVNALDALNHELYTFGGFFSVFGSLNLNVQKWNIKFYDGTKRRNIHHKTDFNIDDYYLCYPYFINQTELHVLHRGKHLMYSVNNDKFITLSSNRQPFTKYGKLLYVKHLDSKLMLFGGDCPIRRAPNNDNLNIWYCDTESRKASQYKWKLFEVQLMYALDLEMCHVLLVYEYIVIVFDLKQNMISCLDLWLTKQWYLSQMKFPLLLCGLKSVFTVVDNAKFVHFIRCKARQRFHIKLPLKQFIPMKLVAKYREHYAKLVRGYIRTRFEQIKHSIVPIPLCKLMLNYFPVFL